MIQDSVKRVGTVSSPALRIPVIALLLALTARPFSALAAGAEVLWQIGKPDHDNAEFAYAPDGWKQFKEDGLFIVGESDAKVDWPYVHPGPVDAWGGSTPHTFTILFGLKRAPDTGECRLRLDLLDTQSKAPPRLAIQINGQAFERALPAGAGDATIHGEPAKGKRHSLDVVFPASLLRTGDNAVQITTIAGSWMLYDWVGMRTPPGGEIGPTQARTVLERVEPVPALWEENGRSFQPVRATIRHFADAVAATVRVEGAGDVPLYLQRGLQTVELLAPAATAEKKRKVALEVNGQAVASHSVTFKPVPRVTVYILPHSHTDIGYTEIQTAIEQKQVNNLLQGIAYARQTAAYPPGARFVWNVEVLWAADLYLRRMTEPQRAEFFDAVKKGEVALEGMYLNELTGLCRPEELVRLFRCATRLADQCGVKIESAMISDVPGYTWGTVPAMSQAGIKYFSVAPNYFDRIGTILREWENKPFYWVGPDGKSKVLVWIPFGGYAISHRYGKLSPRLVSDFYEALARQRYPYDIAYVRWSGHGDNAVPDPAICEFVRDWNARYAWPRFVISSTSEAFAAFEQRFGRKLPRVRGDWTPYWEDGAGSSALETAMNRASSDRLAQAETLYAMLGPRAYPAAAFEDAWNSALLYSEHTWGASCSITDPENQKTKEQWAFKRGYALQAHQQSRELLSQVLPPGKPAGPPAPAQITVYNTLSWPRTEPVAVPAELSAAGDHVADDHGRPLPSQRMTAGELVFLPPPVPPFASRTFVISQQKPQVRGSVSVQGSVVDNGLVRVRLDEKTGGILELRGRFSEENLADTSGGEALNDYLYLPGDDLKDLKRNGPVTIRTGEMGPLVASLVVESDAPGCRKLRREIRLIAGMDYVEVINTVDKERLAAGNYRDKKGKESVNFAFPFHVPDGQIYVDIPFGVFRPELDQMPSACKNWLTAGRWFDVSNRRNGITCVTLDAPLIQAGGITANLLNSQKDPDVWRKEIGPTQKLYVWAMNNHWGTNYRAYQEGPTVFRFVLRPHRKYDPAEATRFATGFSQPLLVAAAADAKPVTAPLVRVKNGDVIVTGCKPSDDGKAWIIRLFGAGGKAASTALEWGDVKPKAVYLSDTSERRGEKVNGAVKVPGFGLATLRAELE